MLEHSKDQRSEKQWEDSIDLALARHPFLRGLDVDHLQFLAQNAMRVQYQPGELIFQEGDPANRFYLIESGSVSLQARSPGKDPVQIQTIGAGDVLGWSWLFPPYTWHFDARALAPTDAIFLYGTRIREHCEKDPALGYELMKRMADVLIKRLQETRRQYLSTQSNQPAVSIKT